MVNVISEFNGEYRFLSNFYSAPTLYEGILYRTSEHAFQAAKTLIQAQREEIRDLLTPGEAKKYAGKKGPIRLRDGWNEMRIDVMRQVLRSKFTSVQNEHLKERLLDTGDAELIEGNTWGDVFWGQVNGQGENWLGRLLMELRADLRANP
jgi:ribA/ribD-fused uncharacterized protein